MIDPAFWSGRRVLITGHTGFKGAWLTLWLARLGAEVHGFSAAASPSEPALFALARGDELLASDARGDVRDAAAVRAAVEAARPEVVVHLAAQALVRPSLRDPGATFAVNVMGTANVLEAVHAAGGARAVLVVTSDKCYAPRGDGAPCREGDPLGGGDPYSASKAAQEHVAAAFRTAHGEPIATARAGNAIGGGDWAADRLVADFARAALGGSRLVLRAPGAVRPWQHVLEPLSGYLRLAERLWESPAEYATAWNFGPAEADARPVGRVVDGLRRRWPGEVDVELGDDAPGELASLRLDASRARERLGWSPTWDLDTALDATVDWYAGHGEGADARELTAAQIEAFAAAAPVARAG